MDVRVRAGGGILWRPGRRGPEVALVHRPRRGDWSLPKGKAEPGERYYGAALREVAEETGIQPDRQEDEIGQAGAPMNDERARDWLARVWYRDEAARLKEVRYWGFRAGARSSPAGAAVSTGAQEVDEVRFCRMSEAAALADYGSDRAVLSVFAQQWFAQEWLGQQWSPSPGAAAGGGGAAAPGWKVPVELVVVRHASAGERGYGPPDRERPLDRRGTGQAAGLAVQLSAVRVTRVLTSPFTRCHETLVPLAAGAGVVVEDVAELSEGRAAEASLLVVRLGAGAAICSHGDVVPTVFATAAERLGLAVPEATLAPWPKGSARLLMAEGLGGGPVAMELAVPAQRG